MYIVASAGPRVETLYDVKADGKEKKAKEAWWLGWLRLSASGLG